MFMYREIIRTVRIVYLGHSIALYPIYRPASPRLALALALVKSHLVCTCAEFTLNVDWIALKNFNIQLMIGLISWSSETKGREPVTSVDKGN